MIPSPRHRTFIRLVLSYLMIVGFAVAQADRSQSAAKDDSTYAPLAKVPKKAAARRNPLEKDPDAVAAGSKLFGQHCAECHGELAQGGKKAPSLLELKLGSDLVELDPRIRRAPEDLLLIKKYASAFLGTPLSATLVTRGVDTLIVTGCTTSGCVRASVVDALSHGFRPIIPHEAVGDRAEEPHEANLFDMDSKYGDVVSLADALAYLEELKS